MPGRVGRPRQGRRGLRVRSAALDPVAQRAAEFLRVRGLEQSMALVG